jgi:hypothetical protein
MTRELAGVEPRLPLLRRSAEGRDEGGRLLVSSGTDPASGSNYMYVVANS